jgi:hypothetical protein
VELALIVALIAVLIGRVERFVERRQWREEQAAWRLERASLLQRIQAPDRAVVAHEIPAEAVSPPAVSMFDDEDHWAAERQLIERIERMERGL